MDASLTERQQREKEFHRQRAQDHKHRAAQAVALDVVSSPDRRWWNAYWSTYDMLRKLDLAGKKVLVSGCGFGEDAIRVASLGAEVYGFDISPDSVEICRERAQRFDCRNVHFDVMPSEKMTYEDNFFDVVLCIDILHHVDIPKTLSEFQRVLKPGGRIVGDELYTHGLIERNFRRNALVEKVLYPLMAKYIYGSETPYITEDEHKIDDKEFALVEQLVTLQEVKYFNVFVGRIVPDRSISISKIDRALLSCLGSTGRFLCGRIVFDGTVN